MRIASRVIAAFASISAAFSLAPLPSLAQGPPERPVKTLPPISQRRRLLTPRRRRQLSFPPSLREQSRTLSPRRPDNLIRSACEN